MPDVGARGHGCGSHRETPDLPTHSFLRTSSGSCCAARAELAAQDTITLLRWLGGLVRGWLLLRGAEVAQARLTDATVADRTFYLGKIEAGSWFAHQVLAGVAPARKAMQNSSRGLRDLRWGHSDATVPWTVGTVRRPRVSVPHRPNVERPVRVTSRGPVVSLCVNGSTTGEAIGG